MKAPSLLGALGLIAAAFMVAVAIVTFGATSERLRPGKVELMGLNPRQMTILKIAKNLQHHKVAVAQPPCAPCTSSTFCSTATQTVSLQYLMEWCVDR